MRKNVKTVSALMSLLLLLQIILPMGSALAEDTGTMLPPSNLTYQLTTPDDVKLSWNSVYGAKGYNVYQITEGQLLLRGTASGTSYTINNLAEGSYTYVVSTLGSEGETGPGVPVTIDIVYPDMVAPASLTHTIQNGNDIVLNWSGSQYAESYTIYEIGSDSQQSKVATVTGRTYTVGNVQEGTYTYAVSTENSLYGESPISLPLKISVVHPTMTAPSNLTFTITNGSDINLKWNTVSFATGYNVYEITDGRRELVTKVSGSSVTLSNKPAGDYTYEVNSYSDRFGESAEGRQLSVSVGSVSMIAPSNFTYSIQNVNDVSLSWSSAPYATSYKLYSVNDGQKELLRTVSTTSTTLASMPHGDYTLAIYSYSDRFGESAEGRELSFSVASVTMAAPPNLTHRVQNGNDIVLSWEAVEYAASYKVYEIINGQKVLRTTASGTTVTYSNKPEGNYIYEVYSYNAKFGESAEGSQLSFALVHPTMKPPLNVVQTIKSPTSFSLNWDSSDYATSYKVYQVVNGQKILKNTANGTTVTFSNMSPGEYTYVIHSVSSRFGESVEGTQITMTLHGQTMEAPTNLTYTIKNGNDISLSWNSVQYATSYKIYEMIDGVLTLKSTVTSSGVTYLNQQEGNHHYAVHAVSTLLGESPEGAELSVDLVFPTMAAPGNLTYKIQNGNDIVLTWAAVPYANSYTVYELIDGKKTMVRSVTSLATTLSRVSPGDHTYIINAVSSRFGESEQGSEVSLKLEQQEITAPINASQTILNGNDIKLTWDAVTQANSYKIYQIIDGQEVLLRTVTGTTTTFTNAAEGEYRYSIHAFSDRFGESHEGAVLTVTIVFPVMAAPGTFTYKVQNGNDVILTWTAVQYATSYKIYEVIDGEKVLLKTSTSLSTTLGNVPEADHTYVVHAVSTRFGESQEGAALTVTIEFPIMAAPGTFTYKVQNGNDVILTWAAAQYATSYKIYEVIDGEKVLLKTSTSLSTTLVNVPEAIHTYVVHAVSTRFGESPEASKLIVELVWPVVQPPAVTGSVFDANNITLSWKSIAWANEYRVYKLTESAKVLIYKGTALSHKVYNLTEDTHSFEVTAFNTRFGESAASNTITETIVYPEMQAPAANLSLNDDNTAAFIYWNFITYANGYNVYELIDGQPLLIAKNVNNLSYTVSNLSYTNHEYFVTSYSNSFGESEASNIVLAKLIVDTEAPVTDATSPSKWTNTDAVVTLSATDNETGVAHTYYSLNGSAFTEGNSITINDEGIHLVSFYSVDKVGNTEKTQTIEVKVDKTAPVVNLNLLGEVELGNTIKLSYSADDDLSGVDSEKMVVSGPDSKDIVFDNGEIFKVDKPGVYNVTVTATNAAGLTTTIQKQFVVYIPVTIEVTPKVIKGNKGVFTVRAALPLGFSSKGLDWNTVTLNGVKALSGNNGYDNQAMQGQFKFERSDFNWTPSTVSLEFRAYHNGLLVIGHTTVKVHK